MSSAAYLGLVIPHCVLSDPHSKKGVNCLIEEDVSTAIHLLNVIKPELQKKAIANKCFDATLKPHMTEAEIVTFCKTNFAIRDEKQIRNDLRNLEILCFDNPDWGINIVQTENNNGFVSEENIAKNMEQLVFNHQHKITSLIIFNPDLPWKCTFYKTFYTTFYSCLVIALLFGLIYLSNLGLKYYRHFEQKQNDEIGFMVEKIIDILQSMTNEEGGENFVVINHVRDMILPVTERQNKQRTWAKAVKFINENESRVRTEIQEVQGEPFEVWRWIGSANLSMSGDHSEYKYRQGRRIVDVQYLIAEVLNFPHKWLRFCSNSDIEIKNEVREGVSSILLLRCKCCNREHPVCSEDPGLELMNINLALVAGIASLGLNMYHLNEICSSLHIPGITKEEYNQYLDELMESYNLSLTDAEKSMKKSYESVKNSFQEQSIRTSTPKKNENVSDYEIKKIAFLKDLEKSAEEIEIIARLTVNQRAEPLWFEERRKRLTASNFGKVFKLLDKTDRKNLVNQITNSTFVGNMYTKYGNENEKNAIKDFENLLGVCVVNCGLFIHQDYPFLAASPDGLIEENAIIEVKCPYKAKELTPEEAINKNLIQYATIENGAFTLKRSDHYYYQVQGQLFVTGRQFCYFVVWTPLGLVYEKIVRDEACWSKMFPKLENFYFQHMLPVLLEET